MEFELSVICKTINYIHLAMCLIKAVLVTVAVAKVIRFCIYLRLFNIHVEICSKKVECTESWAIEMISTLPPQPQFMVVLFNLPVSKKEYTLNTSERSDLEMWSNFFVLLRWKT